VFLSLKWLLAYFFGSLCLIYPLGWLKLNYLRSLNCNFRLRHVIFVVPRLYLQVPGLVSACWAAEENWVLSLQGGRSLAQDSNNPLTLPFTCFCVELLLCLVLSLLYELWIEAAFEEIKFWLVAGKFFKKGTLHRLMNWQVLNQLAFCFILGFNNIFGEWAALLSNVFLKLNLFLNLFNYILADLFLLNWHIYFLRLCHLSHYATLQELKTKLILSRLLIMDNWLFIPVSLIQLVCHLSTCNGIQFRIQLLILNLNFNPLLCLVSVSLFLALLRE